MLTALTKTYAGVGSRETPDDVLVAMEAAAYILAESGWTLRSGGADGADAAFEEGCDNGRGKKEIFLPWKLFNNNPSTLYPPTFEAHDVAFQFHPNYDHLSDAAKQLMARNTHQVLGLDLKTPVEFVICWTKDGVETRQDRTKNTGGTGQAIAIAHANGIPVLNLRNAERVEQLSNLLRTITINGELTCTSAHKKSIS